MSAGCFSSPHLRFTETVDESKAIAKLTGFHIIIAASGMCDAGRIRHHLKRWLWNSRATVLLVGFQAQGTLGRFLDDGAKAVRIQGEEIKVAARIRSIDDYSGHADGPELARWIAARRPIERGLFLVHGEEPAIAGLADRVSERIIPAARVFQPLLDDIYELSAAVPTPHDVSHRRRLAPEAWLRSTGITKCRSSSSISTSASRLPPTTAPVASLSGDCGARWMNEREAVTWHPRQKAILPLQTFPDR